MSYEITSNYIKMELPLSQDVFTSSSREEISRSEILERRFLSSGEKISNLYFLQQFSSVPSQAFSLPTFIDIPTSALQFCDSEVRFPALLTFIDIPTPLQTYPIETALSENLNVEQKKILNKISEIFDELIYENEFFKEIDKEKFLDALSETLDKIPLEKIKISKDNIRRILALEAASGILNELTSEQREGFSEAVKRRPLFK